MPRNVVPLVTGESYHIFNRGVDKRDIFCDKTDLNRFYFCMQKFNSTEPIESVYKLSLLKNEKKSFDPLVAIQAYCLLPNHFHFILMQLIDGGISEYMKRLGGGFTSFFNERHERSGSLFQGTFKRVLIETNKQLLYLSAYVNLNDVVHNIPAKRKFLTKSSMATFMGKRNEHFLNPNIILDQFTNSNYSKEAHSLVSDIQKKRMANKTYEKSTLLE